MDLPKIRIRDTYLFKPKWLKRNTMKVQFKGEYPQNDILRLEDPEGVRKNMKIGNLGKKMKKDEFMALPALGEGRILGGKFGTIKKFPKNSYKH